MITRLPHQNFAQSSLRDFYSILFRQKRKIIGFFLAVMVLTALITFGSPKIYQSETKLMVRLGRESVSLDPTATTGQFMQVGLLRENEIKTELEIIKSRDLAENTVNTFGHETIRAGKLPSEKNWFDHWSDWLRNGISSLLPKWPGQHPGAAGDKAVQTLMGNLQVENQKNSDMISVRYEAKSPKLAQAVVTNLIDAFLEKHVQVHGTVGSDEFFEERTRQSEQKLIQSENALKELKNSTGIGSVVEQRTIVLNRIGDLQRAIERDASNLAAGKSKVQKMGSILSDLPKNLLHAKFAGYSGNPIDFLHQRLLELQIKEKDLRVTMTENARPVQDLRKEIAQVEELVKKEGATRNDVSKLALLSEQANVSELSSKVGALKIELAGARAELLKLNDVEVKIGQLERDIEIQKTNFKNYADKLAQARIDRALDLEKISNISIVQPASYPLQPVRPLKSLNLGLGALLGILGGLGLAFLAEWKDHSFKNPEEVENYLQLPVLASIPLQNGKNGNGRLGTNYPLLISEPEQVWDFTPEINSLADFLPLALKSPEEASHLLAVTSCHPGEGTSTVSSGLAVHLAQQTNGRILFVETNTTKPAAHAIFGIKQTPGLTDLSLIESKEGNGIKPSALKNLDVLPAGQRKVNLAKFFASKKFNDILNLWKREYKFIIFDNPSLSEASWVGLLSRLANANILVVEAERTRREVVLHAKKLLEQSQVNNLGIILNKRQFHIPDYLYKRL